MPLKSALYQRNDISTKPPIKHAYWNMKALLATARKT